MWKYVISWSLFIHTIIEDSPAKLNKTIFKQINRDSAVFHDRDSAITFLKELHRDYLHPPRGNGARAFNIKLDSTYEEVKRKKFLGIF